MVPRATLATAMSLQGRLKLARLLEMPESELARLAARLEAHPLFSRLRGMGVLCVERFPKAYFTARRFAGWGLRLSSEGLTELVDGDCDLAGLMRRIGLERFEECFLRAEGLSVAQAARRCGVSADEARRIRDFLDLAYLREEFETKQEAPAKVFSAVAGIALERGKPVLAFFNREIWKGRYRVDEALLSSRLAGSSPAEAAAVHAFVRRLEFVDRRKTVLYRTLEALLEAQAGYLRTGDPAQRQPLTQRSLSVALGVEPSALNRLISNKSVQLPWGLEAPLKELLPSAKAVALARLESLALAKPGLSDEGLRRELAAAHHFHLSRRSITQYRHDLALAGRGSAVRRGELGPRRASRARP